MRVQVPLSPKKPTWLPNYLSYPLFAEIFFLLSQVLWYIYMIRVQTNIFEQGISIWMIHSTYHYSYWNLQSFFFWRSKKFQVLDNTLFCNTIPFRLFIFNWHRPSHLVKWGWCIGNSRDSSAGRAEDWKSSCHQFKSGSWHMINLSEYLFYKFIDV